MANKPPRRHHYTPKFYLDNFTDDDGRLHIIARDTGKRWASKPENTGLERDFYTLEDVPAGEDPQAIEKAFADFEGKAATVLEEIVENRAIPQDPEKSGILMKFIALAATRVPTMRELISKPIEEIARKMAMIMVSSKESFEQSFPDAAKQGLTYEAAREFVHHGMTIQTTTGAYIRHVFNLVETMLPYLGLRNWCVCYNDNKGEHFVVTDNPVAVTWSDGRPPGFFGPAHGKLETDVTIPLSSRVALLGRFEDTPERLELNAQGVGSFNAKTIGYSQRFIAACSDSFLFHNAERGLIGDKEVIAEIEREAAKGGKKDEGR